MSLPERAKRGRNYDYRYVWIRDQCYAGQAVAADGPHPLLDDAVCFVTDRLLFPSGSPYAPYAVGLSAHVAQLPASWMGADQVAIHPGAFGAVSHGCIHAGMKAIRLLERRVGMGTLVTIKA